MRKIIAKNKLKSSNSHRYVQSIGVFKTPNKFRQPRIKECELGKIGKPPGGKFLPKDSEEKITSWRQTVNYQRHVRGVEDLIHWENAQLLENLSKMQKSEPLCISVSLKECSFHGNWSSCSSCCRRRATRRIILRLSPKEMTMSENEKYLFKSTTTL